MQIDFNSSYAELTSYLNAQGLIQSTDRVIELSKPGKGNMNFVVRVKTECNSIILKQANPYVQKYPHIAAPVNRIHVEAAFYNLLAANSTLAAAMPAFLSFDRINHILAIEDLGDSIDFTFLYEKNNSLQDVELIQALEFINELHRMSVISYPDNLALRQLNHEHIFRYPFVENGFNLDTIVPGLADVATHYRKDRNLVAIASLLGDRYLATGNTLIHGDFYPGSWLKVNGGLKVIDPEFSFLGFAEFDVGVLIAHLILCQAEAKKIDLVYSTYQPKSDFDWTFCRNYAGIEIMRRLLGLAQLPLTCTLAQREQLLKDAYNFIFEK